MKVLFEGGAFDPFMKSSSGSLCFTFKRAQIPMALFRLTQVYLCEK